MKTILSITISIPAYNEEETIEKVVKEAIKEVGKITKDYEILLVDDGSTDNTKEIIKRLSRNKRIRAIYHKKNKGFTGAMKSCLYNAKKHLVFLAPADGQFDFKELNKFVEAIKSFDVAIGYREKREEGLIRKFNSWGFHTLCKVLLGIPWKISSVFLFRRRVIESIDIVSEDKSAMFLPEFFNKAINKRYKFIQVPVHWGKRKGGESKGANPLVILKTFWGMVRLKYGL